MPVSNVAGTERCKRSGITRSKCGLRFAGDCRTDQPARIGTPGRSLAPDDC